MLIFGPVCLTAHEAWVEDRKYVHSNGLLYNPRDRGSDADYAEGEKWLLKNWRGGKCKNKEDQQLFTEAVSEMIKILEKAVHTGPRRQKRRPSTATVATVLMDAATCISDSSDEPMPTQKHSLSLAKALQLMPMNSLIHMTLILSSNHADTSNNYSVSA